MKLDEYQKEADATRRFPKIFVEMPGGQLQEASYIYPALGLAGEGGEVLENVKKVVRNDFGVVSKERLDKISLELGDVLWYVAGMATQLGLSMKEIAAANLEKLEKRNKEGKIKER